MGSAQSTARIEELLQEDQNVKRKRERCQKQSSLLSKLTRQLSIHDNRASAASSWSNGGGAGMYLSKVLSLSRWSERKRLLVYAVHHLKTLTNVCLL